MNFNFFVLMFLFLILKPAASEDKWVWQNPLPQGNTLRAVAFNSPVNGFAVGDAGTILKTTDGGDSWSFQSVGFPNLYAIQFPTKDTGYTVGDSGVVFKTIDAGTHWSAQPTPIKRKLMSLWFLNARAGFAAGDSGTVLATTNGGADWTLLKGVSGGNLTSIHFPNANTGYICDVLGDIFKTNDGGGTWIKFFLESTYLNSIYFANSDTGFVAGDTAIYKTTNGGNLWTRVLEHLDLTITAAQFVNADTVHLLLRNGSTYLSTDGGIKWSLSTAVSTSSNLFSIRFVSEKSGFSVGEGGSIMKTIDGGVHWTALSRNAALGDLDNFYSGISFPTSSIGYISTWGSIYKTRNSGVAWENSLMGRGKLIYGLHFLDSAVGYVAGRGDYASDLKYDGFLDKTTDGGKTWQSQKIWKGKEIRSMSFPTPQTGYLMGTGFGFKTADGGLTWDSIPGPESQQIVNLDFVDSNTGYALSYSSAFKTVDGGETWDSLSLNEDHTIPSPQIYGVEFLDKSTGYIVADSGQIYKTTTGGAKWRKTNTILFSTPLHAIHFISANTGYAVGRFGLILRTTDAGENWIREDGGTAGHLFGLAFTDTNTAYAAGVGYGIGDTPTILKLTRNAGSRILASEASGMDIHLGSNGRLLYRLGRPARVKAVLYDPRGRVASTVVNEAQEVGDHILSMPSNPFTQGIYVLDFRADGFQRSFKVLKR